MSNGINAVAFLFSKSSKLLKSVIKFHRFVESRAKFSCCADTNFIKQEDG